MVGREGDRTENLDVQKYIVLGLFQGALGLAIGVALGTGIGKLKKDWLAALISFGHAAVLVGLLAFMHSDISGFSENPIFYWTLFALVVVAGILQPDNVMKAVGLGLLFIFAAAFTFSGAGIVATALRDGLNLIGVSVGVVFMLVGLSVFAVMIIPLLKGKSIT